MRKVELAELRRKWSELVERAGRGERIGITKRGKLVAVMGPARRGVDLDELFTGMEALRKRLKKMPGVTMKSLIEEGRR